MASKQKRHDALMEEVEILASYDALVEILSSKQERYDALVEQSLALEHRLRELNRVIEDCLRDLHRSEDDLRRWGETDWGDFVPNDAK